MTEKYFWTVEEVSNYYTNLKVESSLRLPSDAFCTEDFTWNEVLKTNSRFFTIPPINVLENLKTTSDVLQLYRDELGCPIKITSSWRSPKEQTYLSKMGKKPSTTSLHLEGLAMDFVIYGISISKVHKYLDCVHMGEVEYGTNYTHISLPTFSKSYL